jgi:AraC-like DNA-binding protein
MNFVGEFFYKLLRFFINDFEGYQLENNLFFRENEFKEMELVIPKVILQNHSNMKNFSFYNARKKEIINEVKRYNREEGLVEKVEDLIKESLSKKVKPQIKDIADELQVSPKTLSRKLKEYGTNYQACVHNMVYLTALDLIKQGLNTKEIAYSLGFNAISGLDYVFHKKTGMSVMQYKKEQTRLQNSSNVAT